MTSDRSKQDLTVTDQSASTTAGRWDVLGRETVYDGLPFVRVQRQSVCLSDGRRIDDFHVVESPDFSVAVPILEDGRILTEWQYKHGAGCYSLAFPAGHFEQGEDPEAAMLRELREETGYSAETIVSFGSYQVSGNQGCGRAHLFALTGCRCVGEPDHDDLEDWDIRIMSVKKLMQQYGTNTWQFFHTLRSGSPVALTSDSETAPCPSARRMSSMPEGRFLSRAKPPPAIPVRSSRQTARALI